jgi:hypothetical protein
MSSLQLQFGERFVISSAFKEWNSVVEALGRGEQIIILRKGGIIEDEGDFVPRERFFVLFPTLTHEKRELLKKFFPPDFSEDNIKIKYWAQVVLARKILSKNTLEKLDKFHIWKKEVVEERFHRWQKDEVWALVVRVFKLPKVIEIKNDPDYAGCKSWIDIKFSVDTSGSSPVVNDEEFQKIFSEIRSILEENKS